MAASDLINLSAPTCDRVRPMRSRIAITTRRLPGRFSASRRSPRSAARFSGRTWPPKWAPSISISRPLPPIRSLLMQAAQRPLAQAAATSIHFWTPIMRLQPWKATKATWAVSFPAIT